MAIHEFDELDTTDTQAHSLRCHNALQLRHTALPQASHIRVRIAGEGPRYIGAEQPGFGQNI